MGASTEAAKFLRIYLSDHTAGATAGQQRAACLAEAEADSPDGPALATFAEEVAADRDALLSIMEAIGVETSRWKSELASVAERIGALKSNGRLVSRSPLSTLVEIEAMQMAVRGKRSLWETLAIALPSSSSPRLSELAARADRQLEFLGQLHVRRAATTFAGTVSATPVGDQG